VHLNAYAQKDPKLIYKKEGYEIFMDLLTRISREMARRLFYVEVRSEAEIERLRQRREQEAIEGRGAQSEGGAGGESAEPAARKQVTVKRDRPKIGRNDPCYCGSGKKYKKCHLPKDEAAIGA